MDDTIYSALQNLNAAATILLKIACAYAVFRAPALLADRWPKARPTVVLQPPTTTIASPAAPPVERPTFPENSMMSEMVRVITTKEVAAPTPAPPPPKEIIECGNCKREITSAPLTSMFVDAKNYMIYECEHCRAQVKLPTN